MNYKILINESGVPVLIKMPIETESYDMTHFHKSVIKRYFQALKAAMKPENQIHFKDPIGIMDSLLRNGIIEDVTPSIVGQTFDLPDNLGVSFESCKMCEGTGQYEKPYQQFIKCNYCSNGKLAILTPITEAPSPSQVLTAEETLNTIALKHGHKDWSLARYRLGENHLHVLVLEAMQEYSTLQTQQLQNRVKELEEQLSVMPTRKHQIVSEVVELREQVKQARNEAIQECLDDLPMESNPENPGNFNEGYNWCLQLVTRMLAIKRNQAEMKTKQ